MIENIDIPYINNIWQDSINHKLQYSLNQVIDWVNNFEKQVQFQSDITAKVSDLEDRVMQLEFQNLRKI